jgi:hypothetical protein
MAFDKRHRWCRELEQERESPSADKFLAVGHHCHRLPLPDATRLKKKPGNGPIECSSDLKLLIRKLPPINLSEAIEPPNVNH